MTPYAKWRLVFWLLVALLVASALFAAYEVWSDLRPASCCGAAACELQGTMIDSSSDWDDWLCSIACWLGFDWPGCSCEDD